MTGLFTRMMADWKTASTSTSDVVGVGASMVNSIATFRGD